MVDGKGPYTHAWRKRQAIWRHNGLLGSVAMAQQAMVEMQTLPTTTDETRRLAQKIEGFLHSLADSLRTRRKDTPNDT